MESISNGVVTLTNGLFGLLDGLTDPVTLALVLCAVSLAWLARIEVDELDRQGTKPDVGRH